MKMMVGAALGAFFMWVCSEWRSDEWQAEQEYVRLTTPPAPRLRAVANPVSETDWPPNVA